STVQSWPDGYIEGLVENASQLDRRQTLTPKTQSPDAAARIALPEDLVPAQLLQVPAKFLRKRHLVLVDALQAHFLHVFHARNQSGDAEDIGSPSLQEVRKLARLRLTRRIAARAAFTPGPKAGARANVERSRARRPQERLVAGKRQQVDRC